MQYILFAETFCLLRYTYMYHSHAIHIRDVQRSNRTLDRKLTGDGRHGRFGRSAVYES